MTTKFLLSLVLLSSCGYVKKEKSPSTTLPPPTASPQPGNPPAYPPGNDIVEKQQYIVFHNLKRCWHAVPDLAWDNQLAEEASTYAKKCSLRKDPYLDNAQGENIAFGENLEQIKAQDNWYMQFLYFPYGQKEGSDATQEFSTLVWKGTTRFGCGSAKCGSSINFYVCRYSPRGNIAGEYDQNVFKLKPDFATCNGMPKS